MVMWRMATMRNPLRSNRSRISPVSGRAKASGLTRIRVRCTSGRAGSGFLRGVPDPGGPGDRGWPGALPRGRRGVAPAGVGARRGRPLAPSGLGSARLSLRRVARRRRSRGRAGLALGPGGYERGGLAGLAPAAAPGRDRAGDLRLAVRTHGPGLIQRPAAVDARVLEPVQTAGTNQEVALDLVVAVGAQAVVELVQTGLSRLHLELALAHVLEVLRRAHDHVHDGAHEGK